MLNIDKAIIEITEAISESAEQIGEALRGIMFRLRLKEVTDELDRLNIVYENRAFITVMEDVTKTYIKMSEDEQVEFAKKLGGLYGLSKTDIFLRVLGKYIEE